MDQTNSLESQKKYFTQYISNHPHWTLSQIYVDEGISGTSTQKRAAFNRMMADASLGRFRFILTKEISRFARNTLDSIFYTRKLKELGIGVIFMNDNIQTLDPDAELRLAIMASIAQEESRKISQRVKWGQNRRMEQGVVFGRSLLGYDVKNGKMTVNEEGAKTVRLIFHKFVNENKGTHIIARELQKAGIPTVRGASLWSNSVILRILQNEKYIGDLIQKKTYTPNYLTHQKKYNHGEEALVVQKGHHEPIIDPELFDKARQELTRRQQGQKRQRHSNRYCFSGKIKCGHCGHTLVARTKTRKDGSIYRAWRCYQAVRCGTARLDSQGNPTGCPGCQIGHEHFVNTLSLVVKGLPIDREALLSPLFQTIFTVVSSNPETQQLQTLTAKLEKLYQKKLGLIDLYLSQSITQPEFDKLCQKYENCLSALKQQEQVLLTQDETKTPIPKTDPDEILSLLRGILEGEIPDETFYHSILDTIIVCEKSIMEVKLRYLPYSWRTHVVTS
jgi:DNA invertase Pin-like site-specific DNA recombinase